MKLEFDNNRNMKWRAEPECNADAIAVVASDISLLFNLRVRFLFIPFHGQC